MLKKKVLKK